MNLIKIPITFLIAILIVSGCKKDNQESQPETPTGSVELIFIPMVGNAPLYIDSLFVSPAGEAFRIHNLKFFLSDIGFAKSDNSENKIISDDYKEGVFLIDLSNPNFDAGYSNQSYKIKFNVIADNYKDLRFNIGVPRELNKSDPTTAPAPLNLAQSDMYWSWNSGYIFLLAEGNGPDVLNNSFHLGVGEDKRTMPFSFGNIYNPAPFIDIQKDKTTRIIIQFDFQKLLINGDGSNYTFSTLASTSVHGGYVADQLSSNATNTMKLISSAILP